MDNKDTALKLKAFFETRPDVELAFLFGSAARGRSIEESDIDVAVWLKKPNHAEFKSIWSGLEDITGRSVDLIDLRQAAPQIAWQALRGRRLLIRDEALFLRLVLEKSREAEDFSEWVLDLWRLRQEIKRAG